MTIRLHNTLTRKVEDFAPIDADNVRMYVCGPTVYDRAHLGNARPVVVFDTLFRLLRHTYGDTRVTYVRNFTDVDDKINARAAESGRTISDITEETIGWYHADMDALGASRPTHEPRATAYIVQMVAMIEGLIASGHAYEAEGHVLFAVDSYTNYGRLSGRTVEDMIAGARVEVAPYKRNPMDFVLWKPSSDDLPGWESPWGRGRPGWHIECSAMADEILMKGLPEDKKSFDIHAGGLDLQFPHHENEIAQSCCAHPSGGFAKVWLHNEMLQVEGKKMSKSLGNFFTVRDLLDQGIPGEVIRFVLLSTHYRKPMDWTKEKAKEALITLSEWGKATEGAEVNSPIAEVVAALSNDLNTPAAIAALHGAFKRRDFVGLASSAKMLGLSLERVRAWPSLVSAEYSDMAAKLIENFLKARFAAKEAKNFALADRIRNQLTRYGLALRDAKSGTEWDVVPQNFSIELDALGISDGTGAAPAMETERRIVDALRVLGAIGEQRVGSGQVDARLGDVIVEIKKLGKEAFVSFVLVPLLEDMEKTLK